MTAGTTAAGDTSDESFQASSGVTATSVSKTYDKTTVLHDVDFSVGPGEVHALLGANGAGKSTLLKILTGAVTPDPKSLIAMNREVLFPARNFGTKRVKELGMHVLHQEAPLVKDLTVAENVGLAHGFPGRGLMMSWPALNRYTRALLDEYEIDVEPWQPVSSLTSASRAAVGLAMTLGRLSEGPTCLILDEATATLPSSEGDRFLRYVRTAADKGASVVFVTHRLHEVHMVADRVTVLRAGRVVHSGATSETTEREMVQHIVGHNREGAKRAEFSVPAEAEPVVQAQGLRGGLVKDGTLTVRRGEILGIAGLRMSGASTLAAMIAGAAEFTGGTLDVLGESVRADEGPRAAMARGCAYLPADRLGQSGNPEMSIQDNVALPRTTYYWRRRAQERSDVDGMLDRLRVQPSEPWRNLGRLSGGNQQRVLLGKWLLLEPRLLVLDEPTYGLDVGAADIINQTLHELATAGATVLVVSGDAEQLLDVCSRIVVMRDGVIVDELTGARLNKEELSLANR